VPGAHPAACLGHEPRIWVVGSGYANSLFQAITQAQAAVADGFFTLFLL
jgi:hypothetical protein